jgi:hypothetical protein
VTNGDEDSAIIHEIGECGTDLTAWPDAKHFTSWLCLAPANKISDGKTLSTRTVRLMPSMSASANLNSLAMLSSTMTTS